MFKNLAILTGMTLGALSFSGERQDMQDALDCIYRADTYIVNGNNAQARNEVREARSLLRDYDDNRDIADARDELSETLDYIGVNREAARTHLNNAETIVEDRIEELNRDISRAELRRALDAIYRADTYIVNGRYTQARNEENDAIDTLDPYADSDDEMADAVRYLRRSLRLIGRDDEEARTELNNAESIIESRI